MLRGQIGRSRGKARSPVDVHRFREILVLRPLDHDLLANVAKRVGDRARRDVATEHVHMCFRVDRSLATYAKSLSRQWSLPTPHTLTV